METGGALLVVGMVAVAANLRPAAASVGPVVDQVRDSFGLSPTAASALLALPLVCFGAMALLAPLLATRLGHSRSIALALVTLMTGLLLRIAGGVGPLFAGTLMAGASIAIVNVMLPILVKRSFPDRTGSATAFYVTSMIGVASLAAGLTVPIEQGLGGGWKLALGIWAVPALFALATWLPQLGRRPEGAVGGASAAAALRLAREPVARQLTLFFGLQSASFYAVLSWLPTVFKADGVSSTSAGVLLGVSMLMGLPAALVVPGLAARAPGQSFLAVAFSAIAATGFAGLILAPSSAPYLWAVLIGLGQGACFPLALTLIVLRSGGVAVTTALSTLVQGCGYLIAACGPLVAGALHDVTGSWSASVALLLVLLVPQALTGAIAGRAVQFGGGSRGISTEL